jgi:hypothetical protein
MDDGFRHGDDEAVLGVRAAKGFRLGGEVSDDRDRTIAATERVLIP